MLTIQGGELVERIVRCAKCLTVVFYVAWYQVPLTPNMWQIPLFWLGILLNSFLYYPYILQNLSSVTKTRVR